MKEFDGFIGENRGARYLAFIIDNIIAILLAIILIGLVKEIIGSEIKVLLVIASVMFYLLYFFIMESLWSRTLGKIICSLEITNKNGEKINWKQALIRTLTRIVELNIFIGALPAIICVIVSKRNQRIGDMIAKTVVNYKYD